MSVGAAAEAAAEACCGGGWRGRRPPPRPTPCHPLTLTGTLSLFLALALLQGAAQPAAGAAASGWAGAAAGAEAKATFLSVGRTFRVVVNDSVVLPCQVTNPGKYVLVWKRGIAVLTAGATRVSPDDRLRLVDGYDLEIRQLATSDAGDYACQIGALEPKEITHTLEILVPPRIDRVSSEGEVSARRGATVVLECRASGNPVPAITWTRKGAPLPSGEQSVEGFSLTLARVAPGHGGDYECAASNGVGAPATARVALRVHFAPEIEVERPWVHSGLGHDAQLECTVHAEPPAEVAWFRGAQRLWPSERVSVEARGPRHALLLRRLADADFANYTCAADNALGKAHRDLQLSGVPMAADFSSHPLGRYTTRYNLTWWLQSLSPVEEIRLAFRQVLPRGQRANHTTTGSNDTDAQEAEGEWREVVLSGAEAGAEAGAEGGRRGGGHELRGLRAGAQYEATLRARNRFGWGLPSATFHFATRATEMLYSTFSPDPEVLEELQVRDLGRVSGGSASARGSAAASAAASACPLPATALLVGLATAAAAAAVLLATQRQEQALHCCGS